jgi:hypothetical protein
MRSHFERHPHHSPGHVPPLPHHHPLHSQHASQQRLQGISQTKIFVQGEYRYIIANGIPNHEIDSHANLIEFSQIRLQQYLFRVQIHPDPSQQPIVIHRQPFGVAINGVTFDPESAEFWNRDRSAGWQYEAMAAPGLDVSHGHVRPDGTYHYHGLPTNLILSICHEPQSLLLGYAADGFSIYNQYDIDIAVTTAMEYGGGVGECSHAGVLPLHPVPHPSEKRYISTSTQNMLQRVKSSYQLKSGNRKSGPGGTYDGTFVQDYEFIAETGTLDECNGHFGVTPEHPEGIYHYHVTEEFPFISRYFRGTPDPSFSQRRSRRRF